jgi:hypothetical protein
MDVAPYLRSVISGKIAMPEPYSFAPGVSAVTSRREIKLLEIFSIKTDYVVE